MRLWDFFGFFEILYKDVISVESNIVVGVIDSGIWFELLIFSDDGFDNFFKKWKGVCKGG